MIKFNEFQLTPQYLLEKQLLIQNGANYGQAVFLAGGSASGKSFAREKFMQIDKFKVIDVDDMKTAFIKYANLKNKYPEIQHLDLTNPKDVFFLHTFLDDKKIKTKILNGLLMDGKQGRLPNIMFDSTFADIKKLRPNFRDLQSVGYKPENIHIVWVLQKYSIAVKLNRAPDRGRIVPEDILLKAHEGAANTMHNMIMNNKLPKGMNGGIYVILNDRDKTIFWKDKNGKTIVNTQGDKIIRRFTYITVKEPNKPIRKDAIIKTLQKWIMSNAPMTELTKHIWKGTN